MNRLAKQIERRGESGREKTLLKCRDDFDEPVPPDLRKKGRKRGPLTVGEKVSIVHSVLVKKMLQKDVAKMFRVSPAVVCKLSGRAERNKEFLDCLFDKRDQKEK